MAANFKILLIEDEDIIIDILYKKLIREGYDVVVARNGREGLEKMQEWLPDLVLLDMVMPLMSGLDVLKAANQDPKLRDIPVIIVSNSGQPVELSRAQELGARDWLVKTEFNPQEVVDKVKNVLG